MIVELFDGLKKVFDSHTELKRLGRKIYLGLSGDQKKKSPFPFVDVSFPTSAPTNAFSADLQEIDFRITCFTKREQYRRACQLVDTVGHVFSYCDLRVEHHHVVGIIPTLVVAPELLDGTYQGYADFLVTLQAVTMKRRF